MPESAPDNTPDLPEPKSLTFEQAVAELEGLIARIERGDIGLEESLAARRRGDALVARCRSILATVEQELEQVSPDADQEADAAG